MVKKLLFLVLMLIIAFGCYEYSDQICDYMEFGYEIAVDMIDEYMNDADSDSDGAIDEMENTEEEAALVEYKETIILENQSEIEACYYYNLLSDDEQELYLYVYSSYIIFENTVDLSSQFSSMSSETVHKVHRYVILDNPEIFWIGEESTVSYVDTDQGQVLKSLNAVINYSEEEIEIYKASLDNVMLEVFNYIGDASNNYEKALKVYEYIILSCEYDFESAEIKTSGSESTMESVESGTVIGALINNTAVCSGYAKAFDYILNYLGIECFSVVGEVDSVGHEWSMLYLAGEYYNVDCTWGDAIVEGVDENYIIYDYFCLTTQMISTTHTESEDILYPECNSFEYNYYNYMGLYFESYLYEEIYSIFEDAIIAKEETVSLCFASENIYQQALTSLLEEDLGKIINAYSSTLESKCSYLTTEDLYVISINLVYK